MNARGTISQRAGLATRRDAFDTVKQFLSRDADKEPMLHLSRKEAAELFDEIQEHRRMKNRYRELLKSIDGRVAKALGELGG